MQTLINNSARAQNFSKAIFCAEPATQKSTAAYEQEKQTLNAIDAWKIRSMSKPAARRQHRFIN